MKLNKFYTIDECLNEEELYQRLDTLVDDGKIEYELIDKWMLKIKDLDLTTNEEKSLVELLDSLDIFEVEGEEEEEDDLYLADDDAYKPRRGNFYENNDDFGDY